MSLREHEPSSEEYPEFEPEYQSPRWGVIFMTGLISMMVVVFGGLLLIRARDSLNDITLGGSTNTPRPTATIVVPVLALEIPQESQWTVQVDVENADGTRETHMNSGSGMLIFPPVIDLPSTSHTQTTIRYQLMFTLPDFQNEGVSTSVLYYDRLGNYLDAVTRKHYAMYDAQNRFLGIRMEADVLRLPGMETRVWEPPPTPLTPPTPQSTITPTSEVNNQ